MMPTNIPSDAIQIGSVEAQVDHDAYDLLTWQATLRASSRLRAALLDAQRRVPTASILMRDLFWSFYKAAPTLTDASPSPAAALHRHLLEQMMHTVEWTQMREFGSVGDPVSSAMGTLALAESLLATLDQDTIDYLQRVQALQQRVQSLLDQAAGLQTSATLVDEAQAERLAALAGQQTAAAQEQLAQLSQLLQQAPPSSPAQATQIRQVSRQALQQTMQQVQGLTATMEGLGLSAGLVQRQTTEDKLALAEQLGRSDKLKDLAALCGKLTAFALFIQQAKMEETPEQVDGVTIGRHLNRLLPGELALLMEDSTERLFAKKWREGQLLEYDLHNYRMEGQGPIIVALDSSGSMDESLSKNDQTTKEIWSKAVAMALLSIANQQERDIAILHFSNQVTAAYHFARGQATVADLLACLEHFDNGGTRFEPWMRKALELVDTATFDRADVICISDGLAEVSEELAQEWNRRRQERGMRTFGILLSTEEEEAETGESEEQFGASVFRRITDVFLPLKSLSDESRLAPLFAI